MVTPPRSEIKPMLNEVIDFYTVNNYLRFNHRMADATIDMDSFVEANMVGIRAFLKMVRVDPSDSEKGEPCHV